MLTLNKIYDARNIGQLEDGYPLCIYVHCSSNDGAEYKGEWKHGKYNGKGTFTYPNGRKYVGEWKDNKPNGYGTATYPDGSQHIGEWKEGKLIRRVYNDE